MLKRLITVCALAGALAAGPLVSACGDCCPAIDASASVAAVQGCCGNCAPSLEKAADPASLAAKAAMPDPAATADLALLPFRVLGLDGSLALSPAAILPGAPPLSAPRPLRL